jgi:hypothetical protein
MPHSSLKKKKKKSTTSSLLFDFLEAPLEALTLIAKSF